VSAPPAKGARKPPGRKEFVALIAATMAVTALSIDLILPAFDDIRDEFGLASDSPETAGIVTAFLLGLALPQLIYGPLADRFGRKPLLYAGFSLFAVGAVISATAGSLSVLLVGRFIWGLGAAGPRVVTLSMIRDRFEGEAMARVMSFIMAVFILVPIIAPSLGAGIAAVAPWRAVLWFCVLYLAVVAVWTVRLPETLHPANRIEASVSGVRTALAKVVRNRQTLGYLVTMTSVNGVFVSYLASSELIWDDVFDKGDQFPFIFGGIAMVLGTAMFTNGLIVGRVGVHRLVHRVLLAYIVAAATLLTIAFTTDGTPPFWVFLPALALALGLQGLLIPNLNTLAMAPVGEVAGTASAVIGTVSTSVAALLGLVIDRSFNGTITPLAIAFGIAAIAALTTATITERGKLQIRARIDDPAALAPPLID
jgi:DHA1 family bicyclomycin/chloramphenicol resistance-like MFS transporter